MRERLNLSMSPPKSATTRPEGQRGNRAAAKCRATYKTKKQEYKCPNNADKKKQYDKKADWREKQDTRQEK